MTDNINGDGDDSEVVLVPPSGDRTRDTYHLDAGDGAPVCGIPLREGKQWKPVPRNHDLAEKCDLCKRCDPTIDVPMPGRETGESLAAKLADDDFGPEQLGLGEGDAHQQEVRR
jgi:hypothetical protein